MSPTERIKNTIHGLYRNPAGCFSNTEFSRFINFTEGRRPYGRFIDVLQHYVSEHQSMVIIHDNDPDGWAASELFKNFLENQRFGVAATAKAIGHGASFLEFVENCPYSADDISHIVVLDLACTKEIQEKLRKHCRSLLVIDHHTETYEGGDMAAEAVIKDTAWSTTMLVEGFYVNTPISPYVPHSSAVAVLVNHYDTWRFNQPGSEDYDTYVKAFIAHCFHVGMQAIDWGGLVIDHSGDKLVSYIEAGLALKDIQDKAATNIVKKYLMTMTVKTFVHPTGTLNVDVINGPVRFGLVFHSDMTDIIAEKILENKELDFAAIVYVKDHEKPFKISLRSADDRFDVSEIAQLYGGGGHRNAAGMQVDFASFSQFLFSSTVK